MIEKVRKIRDNKGVFAAVISDLSKAFDFASAYLHNRKQKTKVDSE